MGFFFSVTEQGFFHSAKHSTMPLDAWPITDAEQQVLYAAIVAGKRIEPQAGNLIAVDPTPPDPAVILAEIRARTSITRVEFCKALRALGVMTAPEAIAAAKGEWPAAFAAALAVMPGIDPTDAQIEWAGTDTIHRMYPLFLELLAWHGGAAGLTPAQSEALGDQIFGITVPTP